MEGTPPRLWQGSLRALGSKGDREPLGWCEGGGRAHTMRGKGPGCPGGLQSLVPPRGAVDAAATGPVAGFQACAGLFPTEPTA